MRTLTISAIALIGSSASLVAQKLDCIGNPGASFGVVSFQCANCIFKTEQATGRAIYLFGTEPVVTEVTKTSTLADGDVIEAVDSLPITSDAGARRFVFPGSGSHTITVRRGRDRREFRVQVNRCQGSSTSSSSSSNSASAHSSSSDDGIHTGKGAGYGLGIAQSVLGGMRLVVTSDGAGGQRATIQGAPLFIVDGVKMDESIGRFGFATDCRASCSAKQVGGRYILKYENYPIVAIIRERSVAESAGLKIGDEILTVNGRSILADDALEGTATRDELRLTVRRDGREIPIVLFAKP